MQRFNSQYSKKKGLLPLNSSESPEEIRRVLESQRKIYIDGTEQPIRRPSDNKSQKENYSGKKKRHTSKALVIADENKFITAITPVYVGKSHDFGIFKEENLVKVLPSAVPIYIDTGFEGIHKMRDDLNIRKPKKKPRIRKLNGGERLGNRLISKERVKVEHAIGGVKRFKIVSTIFRGITKSMNHILEVACGLWNFHVRKNYCNH